MRSQTLLITLAGLGFTSAAGRTSAPNGCHTVPIDYSTIQKAINAVGASSAAGCIYIAAGTYQEQVLITTADITIYGETSDTSSYSGNEVTITSGLSQANGLDDDGTATVRAHGKGLKIYNVNIVNSYGQGSQAVALSADATEQSFYGVQLIGYQDTLLAETGNQLYVNSYIEGAIDYIFGQTARAWFENVDLYSIRAGGSITANGRDSESNKSFYVFNQCNVDGSAIAGTTYLGRPWGDYARVTFQKSTLGSVVASAGWIIWATGDERTSHVAYSEYGNTGAGAASSGKRASFATTASSAVTIATILGSDYTSWVDTTYL